MLGLFKCLQISCLCDESRCHCRCPDHDWQLEAAAALPSLPHGRLFRANDHHHPCTMVSDVECPPASSSASLIGYDCAPDRSFHMTSSARAQAPWALRCCGARSTSIISGLLLSFSKAACIISKVKAIQSVGCSGKYKVATDG